jgi:hypothetical protein
MQNHVHAETAAFPIDWLVTPALAFGSPREVLGRPGLSRAERRAILASWAYDARAAEADEAPAATLMEVLEALRTLDPEQAPKRDHSGRPLLPRWLLRGSR